MSSLLWNVTYLFPFSFIFPECYEPTPWQSQVTAAVWQWEKVGTDLWPGKKQWCFYQEIMKEEISSLNILDSPPPPPQEMHGFLFCDLLPSCFLRSKEKLENDFFYSCMILILSFIFRVFVLGFLGDLVWSGGHPNSDDLFFYLCHRAVYAAWIRQAL